MSKTLLLADDSVVIQKLVGLSFANEDLQIVTTDNGDDAVIQAREIIPDVVLADVVMPGKNGYEVCEAIKQDPALAHIPVLLLTGTFEAFDEGRAATVGANGQITKPFEAQALVERVNEVMAAAASIVDVPAPESTETATPEATAATIPSTPTAPGATRPASSTGEYDFFDSDVATLSNEKPIATDTSATDQTAALDSDATQLFGAPGEGGTDLLDTLGGSLALGESVASDATLGAAESDATIVMLPDPPAPLPPSAGAPSAGFEQDLGLDLDSAVDAMPVADPGATIVAGLDDKDPAAAASTSSSASEPPSPTVHTPSSAIDHDAAAAPSPAVTIGKIAAAGSADATVVADLDVSLAEAATEFAPAAPPDLDLGPSNVAADDLDFAFDVSEQTPAGGGDPLSESFSSLMDISESQILGGSASDHPATSDATDPNAETILDDSFAVGFDVSTSDLATASPPTEPSAAVEDSPALAVEKQKPLPPTAANDLELGAPTATTPTSTGADRIPDLSPLVEQRIQETLEKVAWEAFSDLSESIVKQVIARVERVAWDVIPQMAETLVREEIRKMKGEKD